MVQRNLPVKSRRAYTLLEVVLSVTLAVLLMGGLYVAMWSQYDQTEAGREIIDQTTIARSLFRRISSDILSHLPPVDPRLPVASEEEAPEEEPAEGEEEAELETEMAAADETDLAGSTARFNRGVLLYSDDLILLTGRVPRGVKIATAQPADTDQPDADAISDLRLVRYLLVMDGDKSKGLARIEATNIMSQEALDAAGDDEPFDPTIIAPEVKSLTFRFFGDQGGTIDWHEIWDGAAPAPGSESLDTMLFSTEAPAEVGPPAAIEITLKLGRLDLKEDDDIEENWTTFRHVVAIPTANGLVPLSELQGVP